jgi:hypothetical protein
MFIHIYIYTTRIGLNTHGLNFKEKKNIKAKVVIVICMVSCNYKLIINLIIYLYDSRRYYNLIKLVSKK